MKIQTQKIIYIITALIISACTSYTLEDHTAQYLSLDKQQEGLLNQYAPTIKIYDYHEDFNKIGTPTVSSEGEIWIDSAKPSFYTYEESFTVGDNKYHNLIYRVHFSEIPFSIIPFHLSKGFNVGLIFVITLNENEQPVLVTTVHTCGCYKAIQPTSYTPKSFYPENWNKDVYKVYGERLTPMIALDESNDDICIAIRPHEHRVMDVSACDASAKNNLVASQAPLLSLRALPSENGPENLYHEEGILTGHVKGSVKPWETLLMSWMALDLFVGTDKALIRGEGNDNRFYTSLKPWRREVSDMANFPRFLDYWGWKL